VEVGVMKRVGRVERKVEGRKEMRGKIGLSVGVVWMLLAGCNHTAMITPTTRIETNPSTGRIEVFNTKDVDVEIQGLTATRPSDGAGLTLERAVISDKSSPVIVENVKQMEARVKQMEQEVEALRAFFAIVPETTRAVIEGLKGVPGTGQAVSRLQALATLAQSVLDRKSGGSCETCEGKSE